MTDGRRLALIDHDNREVDLVAWSTFNRDTLARFRRVATRHFFAPPPGDPATLTL